jgi:hypothetical protein
VDFSDLTASPLSSFQISIVSFDFPNSRGFLMPGRRLGVGRLLTFASSIFTGKMGTQPYILLCTLTARLTVEARYRVASPFSSVRYQSVGFDL